MAGAVAVSIGKPGKRYNAKMTAYVWFLCLIGGSGGLLLGYDNGVIGGVTSMEAFQYKFFRGVYDAKELGGFHVNPNPVKAAYCSYNNQVLQLVVSSLYISALFSGIIASKFARLYGRKPVNIVAGAFFIVGAGILAGAVDVAMLVIGRVLLGVGVGLCSLVMPMYNAEVAPPHLRGGMNILFQWFVTFGILCAGLINYGCDFIDTWGWRLALGLAAIPGAIVFLGGLVMPESPSSLIERGHFEKARVVLSKIRGTNDVDEELADITEAARISNLAPHPMRNLFKPQYRPQLTISLLFMMFQQFTGINAIIFYAPVLFNSIGSGHTASLLNTVIIGAVNVLATVVAIVVVDRLGRKFLLIAGVVQMVIAEIVVGITLKYEFVKYAGQLPSGPSVGILVCICVFIAGFAWSWGPIGWLYPTEIQPLEVRAAACSFNVAMNMLFTFVIGQCFVTMLCTMEWGVFLFFAGMCVIMGLWAALLLPETKGVEIESVFRLFQDHWFWSKFPAVKNMSAVSSLPYSTKMGTEANAIGPALVPGAARLSAQPIPHDGNANNSSPLVGGNSKTVI